MPRRKLYPKDNQIVFNMDTSVAVVREPSLVDSFYTVEGICSETGDITVSFQDPLVMLFNQERLSQMGDAAVKMWIKSMSKAQGSAMSELKSQLTDEQLFELVKSRHIQAPSELQAYVEWCTENMNEVTKQLQELQQQQQSESTEVEETKSE